MPEIPDKLFFKIGEVARITRVEPYILRYWESEFDLIRPAKSTTGQRTYRKEDIETILEIKKLLYEERFSIEGAKKRLSKKYRFLDREEKFMKTVEKIKKGLNEILYVISHS